MSRILKWAIKRRDERLLQRFGGIQDCPWCRQCAQSGEGPWSFKAWKRDPFIDVLTCSVCGGTSLWRFELGMFYVGALEPPEPAWPDVSYYDVAAAKLIPPIAQEQSA